jgi:hypothetical protein
MAQTSGEGRRGRVTGRRGLRGRAAGRRGLRGRSLPRGHGCGKRIDRFTSVPVRRGGGQSANDAREVFCKKIKGGTAVDQSSSKEHDSKFASKVRFALDTLPSCNYQQR